MLAVPGTYEGLMEAGTMTRVRKERGTVNEITHDRARSAGFQEMF